MSRSSTEAEYRALTDTVAELSWISSLFRDVGLPQDKPTELYCDNFSDVNLYANPFVHTRKNTLKLIMIMLERRWLLLP